MTRFPNEEAAIRYAFRSLHRLRGMKRGEDSADRDPRLGRRLLEANGLLTNPPISAVITGSKGKGSVAIMAARTLHALGARVGTLTSPHLVSWFERIRVNGHAIPEGEFCRILGELAPSIDGIKAELTARKHLSPQAIFLAITLRYFAERGVDIALLEVGRGGRFDDVALVPKQITAFTPIFREHIGYLGRNLARIAWHKSGILSAGARGISALQRPVVRAALEREAALLKTPLRFLAGAERGRYRGESETGARLILSPYGELRIGLAGRHQAENATLALAVAAELFAEWRVQPALPFDESQMAQIRPALASLCWPGRLQLLQREPTVIMDGAIHGRSARALVASLRGRLPPPVVGVVCVPRDKGYRGVYRALAAVSEHLIITETPRNRILHFPRRDVALRLARGFGTTASFQTDLDAALMEAIAVVGRRGTILIIGTQSILADAALRWRLRYDRLW